MYVDDPNEIIRIQSEKNVYVGDTDWGGTGTAWNVDFNSASSKMYVSNLGAGDVYADASGGLQIGASDRRLKKNIIKIDNALEKVTQKVIETRKELVFLEGELEKAGAKIKDVE